MPLPDAVSSFSDIPSKLQKFDETCDKIPVDSVYRKFKLDWRVLKMLSESMHMLSIADAADFDGGEYLCLLALKINAAVEEIANDLEEVETHIKIENHWNSEIEILLEFFSCYGAKIKRVVAEIGEAVDLYLAASGAICGSWSFLAHSPPRPHVSLLLSYANSVRTHLDNMTLSSGNLNHDISIRRHIDVLDAELSIIGKYINDLDLSSSPGGGDEDDESCRSIVDAFLSHFAAVLVNFAIQSCNYLIHRKSTTKTDSLSPIRLLEDSHHQIDPTNPKFMEFLVNFLIALNKIPGYQVDFVYCFRNYLVCFHVLLKRELFREIGRYTHLMDVSSLIISFLDSSKMEEEEVVQSFHQEITAMLLEMATLFRRVDGGSAVKTSVLFTKICLVKAELCLREQIRKISSSINSNGFSSNVISNCRLETEHQFFHILANLRCAKEVSDEKLEYWKKTSDLVEELLEESSSLFLSFQLKQIAEVYKLKNSLLLLLLKIVLFKAESFLIELSLLIKSNGSSGAAATVMDYGGNDRIAILFQPLEYFKQMLSDQNLKDREDAYMPLVQIEIFAREMTCFSYSFHPSKINKDVIRKMFLSSCEVLDKVKHLNSKANEIGRQFPLSRSPKTYQLGFIDFLVRSLGELLKYDPASIAPVKHHIEEIQLYLKSLTTCLRRVSESDIDNYPELKDLDDRVTDIAYKVEYLIDSIEIDAQWHHFFWLYHLLEELRIVNKEAFGIHLTTSNMAKVQNLKIVSRVSPIILSCSRNSTPFSIKLELF